MNKHRKPKRKKSLPQSTSSSHQAYIEERLKLAAIFFPEMDKDKSGVVSKEELYAALSIDFDKKYPKYRPEPVISTRKSFWNRLFFLFSSKQEQNSISEEIDKAVERAIRVTYLPH